MAKPKGWGRCRAESLHHFEINADFAVLARHDPDLYEGNAEHEGRDCMTRFVVCHDIGAHRIALIPPPRAVATDKCVAIIDTYLIRRIEHVLNLPPDPFALHPSQRSLGLRDARLET